MTVVVLAAEDMADTAVDLLADMAFVAFADMAVVAFDREPVVDTAVGMVDADHTAQVLGKIVAVVDIAVDMVAAGHTVWVLVVEVPAGLVDHSEKKKKDSSCK